MKKKPKDAKELMKKLNYTFQNDKYLYEALTHRSYSNEKIRHKKIDNEKLEFLGDAVVNLMVTEYVYSMEKGKREGELAKMKSKMISEPVFYAIAKELELGSYLFLSNGEEMSGGRERVSTLGDAFEALVGAIFMDSDFYTTKKIIMKYLLDKIEKVDDIEGIGDYKTILQEIVQSKYKTIPKYEVIKSEGPDHDKTFEMIVRWNGKNYGMGNGKSKKEAEKNAAKEAIEEIEKETKRKGRKNV